MRVRRRLNALSSAPLQRADGGQNLRLRPRHRGDGDGAGCRGVGQLRQPGSSGGQLVTYGMQCIGVGLCAVSPNIDLRGPTAAATLTEQWSVLATLTPSGPGRPPHRVRVAAPHTRTKNLVRLEKQ